MNLNSLAGNARSNTITAALLALAAIGTAGAAWLHPEELIRLSMAHAALALLLAAALAGLAAWHASLLHRQLEEAAALNLAKAQTALFGDGAIQTRAASSMRNFRRVILPMILVTLALAEGSLAVLLALRGFPATLKVSPELSSAAITWASVCGAAAIALFLAGMVSSASSIVAPMLRPAAGRLLHASAVCALCAAALLLGAYGHFAAALIIGRLLCVIAFILAAERLLTWLMDYYRPRSRSERLQPQLEFPCYASRLLDLFSNTSGTVQGLLDLLEFQFGLKLSRELLLGGWRRIVLPLLALQLISLVLLSCLTYVPPGQTARLSTSSSSRFLDSGLHLNAPWPWACIQRVDLRRIRHLELSSSSSASLTGLWEAPNLEPQDLLLARTAAATPALAAASISLDYRVENPQRFLDTAAEPERELAIAARRALQLLCAQQALEELLRLPPHEIEGILLQSLKPRAQELGLGLQALRLRLLQPPPAASAAWTDLASALQDELRIASSAQTSAETLRSAAQAQAEARKGQAQATAQANILAAHTQRDILANSFAAYQAQPLLYATFARMQAIEAAFSQSRKIILSAPAAQARTLDLDLRKAQPDLLNLPDQP